jgi:hypothetical protein
LGSKSDTTRADWGQKSSAAIGFIEATASISLKMYLKSLAILEKASEKASQKIIEVSISLEMSSKSLVKLIKSSY